MRNRTFKLKMKSFTPKFTAEVSHAGYEISVFMRMHPDSDGCTATVQSGEFVKLHKKLSKGKDFKFATFDFYVRSKYDNNEKCEVEVFENTGILDFHESEEACVEVDDLKKFVEESIRNAYEKGARGMTSAQKRVAKEISENK